MAELQAKGGVLAGKTEFLGLRPDLRDGVGGHPRLDQRDGGVDPLAGLHIGVILHRRGAADVEGAVVAGAIALIALQDVEERLVAGAKVTVGEVVRMRVAALAGNGVDRLHIVAAHLVEQLVGQRDDVVLAHARFQFFIDHVIDAIDHGCGLGQKLDFVPVLDLARRQHDLLAIDHLDPLLLKRVEHGGLGVVHAHRHVGHACVADQARDLTRVFLHQAEFRRNRPAHAHDPGEAVLGLQPVGMELVVHGGGAEVPDIGAVVAGQQAEAAHLVPLPFADLGGGDVADVVDVKQQQRARIRRLQRLPRAGEAIAAQAVMVDPALEIDRGVAPGGQARAPFPVGVQILRRQQVGHQGARHGILLRVRSRAPVFLV